MKIVASMATIPTRISVLEKTINSVYNNIDILNIYLNGFNNIPDFLIKEKINIVNSIDYGDRSAIGKLYWINDYNDSYHFTIDDDILYPIDYFSLMIKSIDRYEGKKIVGVHGSIFNLPIKNYLKSRKKFHFAGGLENDTKVDMIGTGTMGFNSSVIKIDNLKFNKMPLDPNFAIYCKESNIDLICIKRNPNWLIPLAITGVYDKTLNDENLLNELDNKLNKIKWK